MDDVGVIAGIVEEVVVSSRFKSVEDALSLSLPSSVSVEDEVEIPGLESSIVDVAVGVDVATGRCRSAVARDDIRRGRR